MKVDNGLSAVNDLYRQAFSSRIPLSCNFELTRRCNFRCPHCYAVPHVGEIPTEMVINAVRQLGDMGCLYYTLTGGEALLHPGFEEVCLAIRRSFGVITLFTNGFLLDEDRIEFLKTVKPQSVDITLYGASDEGYLAFCGVEKGFTRVTRNIELALAAGLPVTLKMFVTRDNATDFARVGKIADAFGLPFRYDSSLFPTFEGGREPFEQALSPKEALELNLMRDGTVPDDWFDPTKKTSCDDLGIVSGWESLKREICSGKLFRCKAGRTSMFITCEGKARMCYMIPEIEADLSDTSVCDAWDMFAQYVELVVDPRSECEMCGDRGFCHVCPAHYYHEHGDFSMANRVEPVCALMREKRAMQAKWKG